jgi:dTDP-4-dehydrorhamnose 3,5-epimerase
MLKYLWPYRPFRRYKIKEKPELIFCDRHIDARGYFSTFFGKRELLRLKQSETYIALSYTNLTNTVRGMHFQEEPYSEAKLLKVIAGSISDILIDLDESLSMNQRIYQYELSESDDYCLYIPRGYAHGYQALTDNVKVLYALDSSFSKLHTRGFSPFSSVLKNLWPIQPENIKLEDLAWPELS